MVEKVLAEMVKELRFRTGVGMSKCKDALVRADGDMDKAVEILRKEGMASAVKKEGRVAKEGVVEVYETKEVIALVEVNCETDFVASNEKFKEFVKALSQQAAEKKPQTLETFVAEPYIKDSSITVDQARNLIVQAFGENVQVKRVEVITKSANASYGVYSHMGGKIVSVIEIDGAADEGSLAKDIAMHVAAAEPQYLCPEEVPAEIKTQEEEIARSQMQGKPENIIEKILLGKMKAFYEQVCLIFQSYIKEGSMTVEQYVDSHGKKAGKTLKVIKFWRWKIGE